MRTGHNPTLSWATFRELCLPTLVGWLGFTFVFVMADLLALSELLVNRGLGLGTASAIGLYVAIPAAAVSLPFAVLVGVNMALGRLGGDLELEAMQACGISLRRLVWPIGLFSAAATVAALLLTLVAAPKSHQALDRVWSSQASENPTAVLVAGRTQSIGDWRFEALEVSAAGDAFRGVAIWAPDIGEMLFAESGHLDRSQRVPALALANVEILMAADDTPWRRLHFDSARRELPDLLEASVSLSDWTEAASLDGLLARAAAAPKPAQAREALSEWHRRFALPLSSLGFGLLALPLSTRRKRPSRAGALLQGLAAAILYYALLYMGNGLVAGGWLSPALGVWLPGAVLGAAALLATLRMEGPLGARQRVRRGGSGRDEAAPRARLRSFVLARYIARAFTGVAASCFATLLMVIWLGDVLDNLKWFGRYGATPDEIARFYGPRLIVLGTRILPMALLVAAALSMARLRLRGELAGMRACGVSGLQIGLPVLLPCLAVTLFALVLNTEVMPRAHALSAQIKNEEIKNQQAGPQRGVSWYRIGDRLVVSEVFDPVNGIASGLQVYDLDARGLPIARTDARGAQRMAGETWRLVDPFRVEVVAGRPVAAQAPQRSELGGASAFSRDSDIMTISEVSALIETLEQSGYATTPYRVDRHAKLAWPFACLVLPSIGLLLVLRSRDTRGQSRPVLLATASGVVYLLASGVAVSLGHAGTLPPPVAGWAPVFIALACSAALSR